MAWRFARPSDAGRAQQMMRFDPRFWNINFSRPSMASIVTLPGQGFELDTIFYREGDLVGVIWESVDIWDHPMFTYETNKDYRGCKLQFRWQSTGVRKLDQLQGPTLTIEGQDETGAAKTYYVRLWNYADGDDEDAVVTLDFDNMESGFNLEFESEPVWAGHIDRMFLSIVPPDYVEGSTDQLPAAAIGQVVVSNMVASGPSSKLALGSFVLKDHGMKMATGYDDNYNLTPERIINNIHALGYRGTINHYVGMSHYMRLEWQGSVLRAATSPSALCPPCVIWHKNFAEEAKRQGYTVIFSLSYELFADYCDPAWSQRAENGDQALTGWVPPSTILSPCNTTAMSYLQQVATEFTQIMLDAAVPVRFQIGEPWWWIEFVPPYRIFLYDSAATAAFGGASVSIPTIRSTSLSAPQKAMLDMAGTFLSDSTADITTAVKTLAPDAETLILIYLPTILDPLAPDAKRANVPLGWSKPAFDVLQLEDYDWVQEGLTAQTATGVAEATDRLGYPIAEQHYFSGFVLDPADKAEFWPRIDAAAEAGVTRGTAEVFFWALPQVVRDGFMHFDPRTYGEVGYEELEDGEVAVFPFKINWQNGVNERLQWLTDVLVSNVGNEQRRALRLSPRRQFEVDFLVADSQRTFFDLWLHRMTGTDVLVPLWHDMIRLTAGVDQGDLFIPCDPTDLEFDDGTFALLMGETPFETEKVEIISTDPAGISILAELANNWPKGTRIVPLRRAKLSEQTEMGRASSRVATISAMFNLVKSSDYDPGTHTGDTYLGIPVITQPSHEDNPNVEYPWQFESSDNETGYVYRKSDQGRAMPVQTHIWHLKGRAAKKAFRQFLYRMKGRRGVVWLPTFAEDITLAQNVTAGSTNLFIREIGFAFTGGPTSGREHIVIVKKDGTRLYRKIVGTDGAPAGQEKIILDSGVPGGLTPAQVSRISFIDVARFDQDQVEWQHINAADGASVVKINLRRFRNDRVPPLVGSYPIPTATMSATACGVDTGGDFGSGGIGDGGIVYPGGEWWGGGFF